MKSDQLKVSSKLKNLAAKSGAMFLPFVPRIGLDIVVKKLRKKLEKHYNENPEGLDERKLRYVRGFALKMCDVFLLSNKRLSANCRYKILNNVGNNSLMKGKILRQEFETKEGFAPPALTVVSPTMRCNISCTGCYAFEYNKKKSGDLSYETLEKIFDEAKSMGQYFAVITGGEPFIRKNDLLKILKKYNNMYFIIYTNGQLIDKEVAKELERLGNAAPCISVEGYEKETDARRGAGVHSKVLRAMKYLKEERVPFAISVTVTKKNAELVTNDEFIDFYIKQGALIAWYFQYMPLGRKPSTDMMVTADQRNLLRRRIRELRETDKPIILADFWGDALLTNGCIAAGKGYLHISGNGAIEPCVFTHFHVQNIKDTTIREALKSKFFQSYKKKQHDVKDRFRPCGIIDHPNNLREAVMEARKAGEDVRESHRGAESIITDLAPDVDKLAKKREEIVGGAWENGEL
ncbi:MAG: hypothetical protein ACD_63C00049G0004 [uncultured bacterium]|nr:MAG: hypothetical protein ACD_63C00049G0004 [uncultured bacterium]